MNRHFITGFTSLPDLLTTAFKIKSVAINVGTFAVIKLLSLAGFIYAPHQLVILLFVLMLVDWGTGVYKAIKFKRFSSYTFQRMIWNIFFTFFLIGASTLLAHHLWVFAFLKIADVMITGFLLTYLVSIIENLHEIDKRIIPDKFYNLLKYWLEIDRVINKIFNNEITKEDAKAEVAKVLGEGDATATGDAAEPTGLPDSEGSEPTEHNG